ncbi:MAG TPA: cysteine desulfurase [Myxococcales bacterium]|nr:cysteine desulfurase [Myxococcales bacterium]HIM01185.1 cysteine desulfurase [Myxococcales bacterium]
MTEETNKAAFNVEAIRRDFPIFEQTMRGKPLVFLDSAASAQKPQAVIDRMASFYRDEYASIHRGVYQLSEVATFEFEKARGKLARFINAANPREIIITRNATESINLVAQTWGRKHLKRDDEILITEMEHHANIVPWQMLCEETGSKLVVVPLEENGSLEEGAFEALLSERTKLVALSHVSNALGTINPIREMTAAAHAQGAPVLIDGAQAAPHLAIDVQELDCDFYAVSGHKVFGPSGVGFLYGKLDLLDAMPPYQGGGSMIHTVSFAKTTYAEVPARFEAGTPDIAGVIGLGVAVDYLTHVGMDAIAAWEHELLLYATEKLSAIDAVRIIGTAPDKAAVISFLIEGAHPHDIGSILDQHGIAIRAGHHCAQPVMERYGVPATARASFAFYNTKRDIDVLEQGIHSVLELFG